VVHSLLLCSAFSQGSPNTGDLLCSVIALRRKNLWFPGLSVERALDEMFNMEDSTDSATDEKGANARTILLADS
jgi:hypothetical protein